MSKNLILLAGAAASLGFHGVALAEAPAVGAQSADEVRAIVAEMLSDAETRSSLLQAGGGSGHDGKGFVLASADNNFRLNVGGQIQFRYIANFRDEGPDNDVDDYEGSFQTRRTKLIFQGHVFEPELFYKVQGAFNRSGGDFSLEEAFFGYDFGNGWKFRAGQFKLPFMREELVSSSKQLLVDRSVVNEVFNQDYSQGLEVSYEAEMFRFAAAFSDGFGSRNTDLEASSADPSTFGGAFAGEADWAFTGRVEVLFAGDWAQFADFTSGQGSEFGLMIGGAAHYEATDNAPGSPEAKVFRWTIDASAEFDGWNLFGAFVGSHVDNNATDSTNPDDYGYVIQGGIYLSEDFELFARWEQFLLDDDLTDNDDFKDIAVGFNYYVYGHAAKFTMDVVWYFDETAGIIPFVDGNDVDQPGRISASTGRGIGLLSSPAEDSQVAVRAQFQLLF